MKYFNELFEEVSNDEKIDFLRNLMERHHFVADEFINHYKKKAEQIRIENTDTPKLDELLIQLEKDAEALKNDLETLDFEEVDWDNWHAPGYYVPEYEAAEIMAEEEANDFFDSYEQKAIHAIKNGNAIDVAYILSCFFIGADSADINDPYCSLGDPASDYFITLTSNI